MKKKQKKKKKINLYSKLIKKKLNRLNIKINKRD